MLSDIAARAEEPARVADWSGLTLGASLGYALGGVDYRFPPTSGGGGPPGLWAPDSTGGSFLSPGNGGLAGLFAGYSHQWGALVGGLEASFELSDFKASSSNVFPGLVGGTGYDAHVKWMATLTPRIGYAWNDLQLYGKGGVAVARVASHLGAGPAACVQAGSFPATNCSVTVEENHLGFTVGAGLSWAFAANWQAGLEYAYYDLGTAHYSAVTIPDTLWSDAYTLHPRFHALHARLAYRFGGTSAAREADPPPAGEGAAPKARWTGFYLGAHIGHGWAQFGHAFQADGSGNGGSGGGLFGPEPLGGNFSSPGAGVLGGLQAGYNRQWGGLVGGIELALAITDLKARDVDPFGPLTLPTAVYSTDVKWLATLAPRLGWAWDEVLLYGKAGLAVARVASALGSSSALGCFGGGFGTQAPCTFNDDHIHFGVVLGAGVDYQLTDNWVVGLEYNYVDLTTETYGGNTTPNSTWPVAYTVHPQLHIVKARLSYQF